MNLVVLDENKQRVDMRVELITRYLCQKYLDKSDRILELGGRYGSVSCYVDKLLEYPAQQYVVIEPDQTVKHAIRENKIQNKCNFHIEHVVISDEKQYLIEDKDVWSRTTTTEKPTDPNIQFHEVPTLPLRKLLKKYPFQFNVLLADCEGFLVEFWKKNTFFFYQLEKIIYEEDCTINHPINGKVIDYSEFESFLREIGFELKEEVSDHNKLRNITWILKQ
jgi:FkbM family methyltransferase